MWLKFSTRLIGAAALCGFAMQAAQAGVNQEDVFTEPDVSVSEAFSVDSFFDIEYTLNHNGDADADSVFGFAIEFAFDIDDEIIEEGNQFDNSLVLLTATAERAGWDGVVLDQAGWDDGFLWGPEEFSTADSGVLYSDIFTEDHIAFFFRDDGEGGAPIDPFESQDGFIVSADSGELNLVSEFVALCSEGTVCASGTATTGNVPEPGALALLGTGLIGFGLWRRRNRAA